MNRLFQYAAFTVGLLTITWVGAGYLPGSPLALALVVLVGAFFIMGALELRRVNQASAELAALLARTTEPPTAWAEWLGQVPAALRNAVRLRVEGERVALPGPALAPYLTGLLVLLGMLGTFLGMVVTLKGTGLALENASNASAMLGLMSALARRERQRTAQVLDARIAGPLRVFSRAHQRDESLRLMGAQADALHTLLPALVGQVESLVAQVAQQGQALHERLLAEQHDFHRTTERAHAGLAESVGRALQQSVGDSARLTSAAAQASMDAALNGLSREAATLRDTLAATVQTHLAGSTQQLEAATATLGTQWRAALADQQRHSQAVTDGLLSSMKTHADEQQARSAALLAGVADAHATLAAGAAARDADRLQAVTAELAGLAATLQRQGEGHLDAVAARQQQICDTLERTARHISTQAGENARALLDEIARLMDAAAEAPRAAAGVMAELRTALSDSLARDNAQLEERAQLLATLGRWLDGMNHASGEQRAAIDALVQATTDTLGRAGAHFTATVDAEARSLQAVAAQVSGGAAEVASLGEGFGAAVQRFSQASESMTVQLQRIEAALGHSLARSDEQLAYYVAQAREIVDLTLGSQKQIVEDLQQLARPLAEAGAARGELPA